MMRRFHIIYTVFTVSCPNTLWNNANTLTKILWNSRYSSFYHQNFEIFLEFFWIFSPKYLHIMFQRFQHQAFNISQIILNIVLLVPSDKTFRFELLSFRRDYVGGCVCRRSFILFNSVKCFENFLEMLLNVSEFCWWWKN